MPVRRSRLQRLYRTKSYPSGKYRKEPPPEEKEEGDWCLVNSAGEAHKLPKTMIFLGREECDIEVQSQSVDKRHAVVTFDHYLHRFKIKDLSTASGTYVNETRIPEQEYVALELNDSLRLGYVMFQMERYEDRPVNGKDHEEEVIFATDEDVLPSWASPPDTGSQDLESPMAECRGCIVEQRIEHTCGENLPESDAAHHDLDRSYSHDSIASFGLGCNTWPKKRHKPRQKSVKELFAMDDHTTSDIDGLLDHHQGRVLRGTGAPMNILPDELETVKKGTPLYGQPEWWGEEDTDLNLEKLRSNGSSMDPQSQKGKDPGNGEAHLSPELTNNPVSNSSDIQTQNGVVDPNTSDNVPKVEDESHEVPTTSDGGITNMAFTVDFGEDAVNMEGRRLSDFMPSKIRKSFRERKGKTLDKVSTSSKSSSKEKGTPEKSSSTSSAVSSKERVIPDKSHTTTPPSKGLGRAQSEGREISPTRQRKIDDLWNSSAASSESLAGKRQRLASSKSASSRSMDTDEDNTESSYAKATKSSLVKRRPAMSGSQSKVKSVIRARKAVSQEILASSTQYTNGGSASYLIDKMFQNNSTGSVDSLKTKGTNNSVTECEMYHEAMKYDTDKSKSLSQDLSHISSAKDIKKSRSKEVPTSILKKSTEEINAKQEEDKVSEAGTYTIEEELESTLEDEARKNIDKVFGVDTISLTDSNYLTDDLIQINRKPDKQGELTLNLQNINHELEEIERLERLKEKRPKEWDSMDVQLGSAGLSDLVSDDDENPTSAVPSDAPKWVSQWAALTNQKSPNKSDMELSSPGSSISDEKEGKLSSRTSNGLSRKRPGTGRRLPTLPPGATSPASSDHSATKESPKTPKSNDLIINGTAQTLQATRQRGVNISSHVSALYQDTDTESISLTKFDNELESMSSRDKNSSRGSVASMDTEVLLKDTKTVMAAMEKRVGSKSKSNSREREIEPVSRQENGHSKKSFDSQDSSYDMSSYSIDMDDSLILNDLDCESDTSSVVGIVNGDEDFVKPSTFKSPRDVLGRGKLKLAESLPSKPSVNMSGAKTRSSGKEKVRKHSMEERNSVVSDVYSEVNGDSSIRTKDLDSSEASQFNRQGSKGKGTMSMTRPNRAFALRRARADGDEPMDSARSVSTLSIASTGFTTPRGSGSMTNVAKISTTPQKPRRPMSGKLGDRERERQQQQPDSSRSQASLGAQIVQKSRENLSFARADGGRHSLRVTRSMSIPVQHQQPSTPERSKPRRSEGTPTSSHLQHSKSLRVTGVSARERSSSVSKATSRTNSPKSAERNAWKRRKDYDPRRAVAEAKIKSKDTQKPKSRDSSSLSRSRGVTRSASFTNARDLKLSSYQCESMSSADELSRRSSEASDVFDEGPKRGFVPYSGRSIVSSKVSNSSADDEDLSERYTRSSSAQSQQERTNRGRTNVHMSAFTPPPRKPAPLSVFVPTPSRGKTNSRNTVNSRSTAHSRSLSQPKVKITLKTPSPPPSTSVSMLQNRCSVDSLVLYQSALGRRQSNDSNISISPKIPESYDTIIVSSIYQLSLKLKTQTDRTMNKLRDTEMIENGLDSPLDDLDSQSSVSEIPAFKSANQELAGVLKNLRKLEQHIKVMNKVLFPDDEHSPDTSKEKHEYLQQIERIRNELAGFQPIETPREDVWKQTDTASVESDCEELSQAEYY